MTQRGAELEPLPLPQPISNGESKLHVVVYKGMQLYTYVYMISQHCSIISLHRSE